MELRDRLPETLIRMVGTDRCVYVLSFARAEESVTRSLERREGDPVHFALQKAGRLATDARHRVEMTGCRSKMDAFIFSRLSRGNAFGNLTQNPTWDCAIANDIRTMQWVRVLGTTFQNAKC